MLLDFFDEMSVRSEGEEFFARFIRLNLPKANLCGPKSFCCVQAWLLKNSDCGRGPKLHRVRMPYKHMWEASDHLPSSKIVPLFMNIEFFNSHSQYGVTGADALTVG
jgi:hypothetical protein